MSLLYNIFKRDLFGCIDSKFGLCLLLIITSVTISNAQIINVESLRKTNDSSLWSGSAGLDLSVIKNTSHIFRIANRIHLQYHNKNHLVLFVNNLNFQKVEENSFVNYGTQHLRYNYKVAPAIKLEAFVQGQYDAVSQLDFRGLAGLGPRFKLSKRDNYRFYLGTLVMYEYEKASAEVLPRVMEDVRLSGYFSFSLYPKDNISIVSTTYYQPKITNFGDYRISTETSIVLELLRNLSFVCRFALHYDEQPIADTPNTQYQLTNGIAYSFD